MKKATYLLTYFLISTFCIMNTSCSDDSEEIIPNNNHSYMSINLNSVDYNGLVNFTNRIGLADSPFTIVETNSNTGIKYLWLQGDHSSFQINIRIPEDLWQEGTFVLEEGAGLSGTTCTVSFIDNTGNFDFDVAGEITITNFDLTNNTFDASFNFSSTSNTVTGTLDYPLDDDEFN